MALFKRFQSLSNSNSNSCSSTITPSSRIIVPSTYSPMSSQTTTTSPPASSFTIHKNFTASLKLLDDSIYIRNTLNESISDYIPIKGCLLLIVTKSINIKTINITFNGESITNLYIQNQNNDSIDSNGDSNNTLIKNLKNWNLNDKLLPGCYTFPFEFLFDIKLPESINHRFGKVNYSIDCQIQSCLNNNTPPKINNCSQIIQIIRCKPIQINSRTDDSLAVGNWRDLLYYQISLENRLLTLGCDFNVNFKILPILINKFKIHALKITLYQYSNYEIDESLSPNEFDVTKLKQDDKIQLYYEKFLNNNKSDFNQNIFEKSIKIKIVEKYLKKSNESDYNQQKLLEIYPSLKNQDLNLNVSHKLKISMVLEEKDDVNDDYNNDDDDDDCNSVKRSTSVSSQDSSNTIQLDITNSKDKEFNHDNNNNFMIQSSKPIFEKNKLKKDKVELALSTSIVLLKRQVELGIQPPPGYEAKGESISNEVEILTTGLNNKNKKTKTKTKTMNSMFPPEYKKVLNSGNSNSNSTSSKSSVLSGFGEFCYPPAYETIIGNNPIC
ncbi:hypothetical protein CANARDRAFT_15032 [[Candida] arabinofermentans NRRL YB-2248]|uniref:Arrestin-like N-terminal domain-containing protein n=1 Tax=[Candida] arabinofermentans NRRL YB-2248 TaxID=983967 RepID=A0A1E4T7M4_9ASCO|nr:hypothetical protein CANARDRAFT_15032 [[Candida] arabinofermentans NRRL YB-2248]